MSNETNNSDQFPQGRAFLDLIWSQEDKCEETTAQQIPTMGVKAAQCLEQLGTVLSLLDRLATCHWGCREGDHIIEYLVGRGYSSARAGLRLLHFGFYDEALVMARNIGEIANLLFLFFNAPTEFEQWKQASERERRNNYSAYAVRMRLETLGVPLPVDQDRYSYLSGSATHVTPTTKPQSHNIMGQPVLGAFFQEVGVLLALNEIAGTIAIIAISAAKLVQLDDTLRKYIGQEALKLLRSTGGIDIVHINETWRQLRQQLGGSPPEGPA